MEEKDDAFGFFAFDRHMKKKAVQHILGEGPQEETDQKTKRDNHRKSASRGVGDRPDEEEQGNWQPDDQHGNGADMREELEKIRKK